MLRGRKLLLADDSVTIQKVVALTFGDEGMRVTTVSDGEHALAKLEEINPDIVLADVHMPKLSGYQVCEQIKQDERFRHLPVMLLVGFFEPFDEEEARRVGADDHLTKPFQSIRQLVNKVSSLLGGTPSEEANTQRLPSLTETETRPAQEAKPAEDVISAEALEVTTADTAPLPSQPQSEARPRDQHEPSSNADAGENESAFEVTPFGNFNTGSEAHGNAQLDQYGASPAAWQEEEPAVTFQSQAETAPHGSQPQQPFNLEESHEPAYVPAGGGSQLNVGTRNDDALLDLGDIESAYPAAQEDDFILDLQDEAFYRKPAPAAISSQAEEMAAPAERASALSESTDVLALDRREEAMSAALPRTVEFAEAQFAGEEQRAEFAARETGEESQASAAPEMFHENRASEAGLLNPAILAGASSMAGAQETSAASSSAASSSSSAQTGHIGLDQLSPEAIDAIARRAVELLSEKVVQEIAWEVVPHLAELLIKRRLEEERTQAK